MADPRVDPFAPVQLLLPDYGQEETATLGDADPMRRVRDLAERVAPLSTTVLITGESGVGKERLARWLHTTSPRRDAPFVAVNCGAFTDTLIESELFGHVRGAFTGALADRAGVFEGAHRGTLFLDEIGEVSPAMQVRLLRVLQEREVRRVGDLRARPIDIRLLAATNRDLAQAVAEGRFRADLYFRLRVVELWIPPLRDRPDDLAHLVDTLLPTIAARLGRDQLRTYTPAARTALLAYAWPGNVRELEHAIERACVVAQGSVIALADLPETQQTVPLDALLSPLAQRERQHVEAVLAQVHGDRRRAAALLGMSPSTLKRRLRGAIPPRVFRRSRGHW